MTDVTTGPTLGVDLGGTKVLTALIDSDGHILASHRRATDPSRGAEAVIEDIVACVQGCLGDVSDRAAALGIGVAGQVDSDTGTVSYAPNLGWKNVALGGRLAYAVGMPIVVANDVRAASAGEWQHGVAEGHGDVVTLFVGTGIGGAVVSSGSILTGATNAGGELGHITVVTDGRKCHCPNYGCLEAYAAGWAIAERAQKASRTDLAAADVLITLAGCVDGITSRHVTAAYRADDPLATSLIKETAHFLTAGAVSLVNAFNPRMLVLGGGVIEALPELVPLVSDGIAERALPSARSAVVVRKAALGGSAGVVGAAVLARGAAQRSAP